MEDHELPNTRVQKSKDNRESKIYYSHSSLAGHSVSKW
jgi:hypothetical protein